MLNAHRERTTGVAGHSSFVIDWSLRLGHWTSVLVTAPAALRPAAAIRASQRRRRSPRAALGAAEHIVADALGDRRDRRDLFRRHAQLRQRLAEQLDHRVD